MKKITILIPAYNEALNLPVLVKELNLLLTCDPQMGGVKPAGRILRCMNGSIYL